MTLVELHAAIIALTLVVYAVLGGADFGGGVWDLFATGPRRDAQRALIEHSIAPVWEANHVWLIMAVVVSFTAFPSAFAAVTTTLHLPLLALLLGIVFRGTAFVLRQYGGGDEASHRRWSAVFAVASVISPVFLGVVVGALTAGRVVPGAYVRSWLAPFPWLVGALALALFAALAAVYLTLETRDRALQDDFRRRAIAAQLVAAVVAIGVYLALPDGPFAAKLTGSWWSAPLLVVTALLLAGVLACLALRRYRLARPLAIAEVAAVLVGWGAGMLPYAVPPDVTIYDAAAPTSTLRVLLAVIIAGTAIIGPVFYWLLRVFKRAGRGPAVPATRAITWSPEPEPGPPASRRSPDPAPDRSRPARA